MERTLLSLFLAAVMMLGTVLMSTPAYAAEVKYSDVNKDMWSYGDIMYVTENGLMNGTGGSTFSPVMSLTRGMVVTVLYRMEGSPRVEFKDLFLDVKDRLYYSEAVIWAKTKGIVKATGTSEWGEEYFSPDRDITRQELATMFVRFAEYKNVITENTAVLDKFTDKSSVADWAESAMKWATSVGLINGTGNGDTLSPTGKATREQFAAIMHRYAESAAEFDYNLVYTEPKALSAYTEKPYPLVNDADLYVAVDGNDKNPGTFEKPLATFDAARLKVRELKKTAKDEIVVAFKAGNYGSLNNVTFTSEDSGTETVPIKYCKYGDGEVIFRNGIFIDESEFTVVDGEEAKMFTEKARPNIYKADLTGRIDKFEKGTRLFSSTSIGDEAREPNGRYYTNVTTTVDDHASIMLQAYLPGIVEKFSSYKNVNVNGYLRTGFFFDCFPIKSYDKDTAILTFDFENAEFATQFPDDHPLDTFPLMYEGRTDDLIYFSNLPEFVDTTNEYYFHEENSTLYVYRAKGDYAINNGNEFITVDKGADHLSFCGFEFSTTSSNALIVKGNYFTMDLCNVNNVGGHAAINADIEPIHHFTVKNSEFSNFVDTGINIYSAANASEYKLESAHNVIENNYFHDFTLPMYFGCALKIRNDVGGYIAHNEFYEGGHGGVWYQECIDLIIEYNVFDKMMAKTQDFGAVYTFTSATYRDNIIRYNIFKNIPVIGVYLDEQSEGQYVYGNVFYNSTVTHHIARANHVDNNIFIHEIVPAALAYANTFSLSSDPEGLKAVYKSKPLADDPMYSKWYERWPELYNTNFDPEKFGDVDCIFTPVTYASGNVGFGTSVNNRSKEQIVVGGNNVDYTMKENPFFVNPSIGDYRIREDADFLKIPYEKIGRY